MEQLKVDLFLAQNADKLPNEKLSMVKNALMQLDDSKSAFIQTAEFKDPTITLILSAAVGIFGVDRFMLGQVGLGLLKLFTCGGLYIWWIIDIVGAVKRTKNRNYKELAKVLSAYGILIA